MPRQVMPPSDSMGRVYASNTILCPSFGWATIQTAPLAVNVKPVIPCRGSCFFDENFVFTYVAYTYQKPDFRELFSDVFREERNFLRQQFG
jgi:hypothetical protein